MAPRWRAATATTGDGGAARGRRTCPPRCRGRAARGRRTCPACWASCGAHEVSNVMISGNPWIPVIYRAAPMTDVVTPGHEDGHEDRGDPGDPRVRGARTDGSVRAATASERGHDGARGRTTPARPVSPLPQLTRCDGGARPRGAARRARGSRAREVAFSGAASYAARGGQHEPTNASLAISLECEPVTRL